MAINSPIDPSVLYLHATHISNTISEHNLDTILTIKRSDSLVWDMFKDDIFHERVKRCLHYMGFYGIFRCGNLSLDQHLITALIERWRRETHTFHLPVGEVTIPLQDVEMIWGLKVDGIAVTGIDNQYKHDQWQQVCFDLLGFAPTLDHLKGGHLSMTALNVHCRQTLIDHDSTDEQVAQYCRCIALMTIGGCLLPDSQGGAVKLMYLQHLGDIDHVRDYSWGSATLAYLYRELCNASTIGKTQISGPLYILQIWAWSRLPSLSPDRDEICRNWRETDEQHDPIMVVPPFGERWNRAFTFSHTTSHAIRIIREMLDLLEEDQFLWNVYDPRTPDVVAFIPGEESVAVWRSMCPLICFDIVEMHRPNRVMRQFGMTQPIPIPATDGDQLHKITRKGLRNHDWKEHHEVYMSHWDNRHGLVVSTNYHNDVNPTTRDYKKWYHQITIRSISPTVRGTGYRTGDASFRSIVAEEALALMGRFQGLSLQEHSREAIEKVINDDFRIGRRLYELATGEPPEEVIPRTQGVNISSWQHYRDQNSNSSSSHDSHMRSGHHIYTEPDDMTIPSHPFRDVYRPTLNSMQTDEGTSHAQHNFSSMYMSDVHMNASTSFRTPFPQHGQSFIDLLNDEYRPHLNDMVPNYRVSPVPFPGYSQTPPMRGIFEESHQPEVQQQRPRRRRGQQQAPRRRRAEQEQPEILPQRRQPVARPCGTGGHLHY